jgi:hypothetical protein
MFGRYLGRESKYTYECSLFNLTYYPGRLLLVVKVIMLNWPI